MKRACLNKNTGNKKNYHLRVPSVLLKTNYLRMKRALIIILLGIILTSCKDNSTELNKDISVPVSVMEIKASSIERYISTTGTVKPIKEVVVPSEINGLYQLMTNPKTNKPYALGDYVSAGDAIVMIENPEYKNSIRNNSLELQLETTKQTFDKQKSLYDKGGVTLSELKNAEINYMNAKYAVDDAVIKLRKMAVLTPISGVIVELPYQTPKTPIATGSPLAKIMDYSKLIMEINLAEKDINDVKKEQAVRIMNYTIPNDTLTGKIAQVSPAINADTRSFKAVLTIDNPDFKLRPGMFAKGEIVVASIDNTIVIPKEVILSKQKGNTVYVIDKGLAKERILVFGLENPNEVQIISGLNLNERLVIKGYETLRNSSKVKVVK